MIVLAAAIVLTFTQADIDYHAAVILVQQQSERESRWYAEAHRQEHEREAAEAAERAQEAPRAVPGTVTATGVSGVLARIRECESGGNYQAKNPRSSASGAFQFLDSTWRSTTGLAPPASAYPPATQDAAARTLYASSGTRPWNASKACWS